MDTASARAALKARQMELRGRSDSVTADLRHERDPLTADFADQAIQRANDDVLEAIGESAKHELLQIGHALSRLDAGTYFSCAECGAAIAEGRLRAIPYTDRCTQCASRTP
jgi:RNA polymerase-binding transcription factor DksA